MKNKLKTATCKAINLLLFAVLLFNSIEISANVAAPSQGGTPTAEPTGLENIFITRETLSIDFRPLGELKKVLDSPNVLVEAVYEVENKAGAKNLELVFIVGSEKISDFQLRIDDQTVAGTEVAETKDLPDSWRSPRMTPWEGGRELMFDGYGQTSLVRFSLTIPPGRHLLRANYQAEPAQYSDLEPLKAWQFAYILAPAREWAGFGGLDVIVYVPAGWQAFVLPELEREGDVLKGSFDKLPADALAITTRSNLPENYQTMKTLYNTFFYLAVFGFPLLLIIFAYWKGPKFKRPWLVGLAGGLVWAFLTFLTGMQSYYGADDLIPEAQFAVYGYGGAFSFLFLLVLSGLLFVLGFVLWIVTAYLAGRGEN